MEMRLKHVKGAEDRIAVSKVVIHNPKEQKGHFSNLFKNHNPIYIEIGTFYCRKCEKKSQYQFYWN